MKIFVDADACPVVKQIETIAKKYNIPVVLLCDTNHVLISNYSQIKVIGASSDAVDFALVNMCNQGDIVITQDYGLASMVLGKKAYVLHQSGKQYTIDNIDGLLMQRHISKKSRMSNSRNHIKGPKKRTPQDDIEFEKSLEKLINNISN